MDKITSVEEISKKISEIKNLRKGFITNFYLDSFKNSVWIKNEAFYSSRVGNTFFFIKKNEGFWNVFYNSTDFEELMRNLLDFKTVHSDTVLMFDIIGNVEQSNCMKKLFSTTEFHDYCSFVRMVKTIGQTAYDLSLEKVQFATVKQVKEISLLLNKYFDVKAEQIPYLEELEEYVKQNHILIYQNDNKIIGFVIFEKNKSTQYLRYWFVQPEYRDLKIGGTLLKRFFYEGRDVKRQLFWVIKSNDNAIKRYKHYGFIEDNLFDHVYINKNLKYGKNTNN